MSDVLVRTWKFRAFAPREGLDAFETAVALKRQMWADLCAMQREHAARMAPLLEPPKAERDQGAIGALRAERTAAIRAIRQAFAAEGLSWGDYNAVVFQFDGAVRAAAARGALPGEHDGALGEAVVRQIQGGARPHQMLARSDVWLEYLPPSGSETRRTPGSRRSRYRTARLTFMIRTDRSPLGAAALRLDFVCHRPLPPSASIVEVRVIRTHRPIVTRDGAVRHVPRWHVTFALRLSRPEAAGDDCVGVAFDWRGDGDDGVNLCSVADRRGVRTIGWPAAHVEQWETSRARFAGAEAETDEARRAVLTAEAHLFRRRIEAERLTELRAIARRIVAGAAVVAVENTWLAGKGVKKFTAPSVLRREIVRAAENAGSVVILAAATRGEASKKRAAELRAAARDAISGRAGGVKAVAPTPVPGGCRNRATGRLQ